MEELNFNNLKYNLYELLNVPVNASTKSIKKSFRLIVRKFHPDKITKLEKEIYYNITFAHNILSNEETREKYDLWLLKSNNSHNTLKSNFKNQRDTYKAKLPKNKREAQVNFLKESNNLSKRHGFINEDNRSLEERIEIENKKRANSVKISKEEYIDKDDFNSKFELRKDNGEYSDKIIKYNEKIVPFNPRNKNNSLKFVELDDFNKLYLEDSIQTDTYTSMDKAFKLYSTNCKIENREIKDYNDQTEDLISEAMNKLDFDF